MDVAWGSSQSDHLHQPSLSDPLALELKIRTVNMAEDERDREHRTEALRAVVNGNSTSGTDYKDSANRRRGRGGGERGHQLLAAPNHS